MKKRTTLLALAIVMALVGGVIAGCSNDAAPQSTSNEGASQSGGSTETDAPAGDATMQYISVDDAKKIVDDNDDSYLLVDVSKAADYSAGHIDNAISADMDAAKEGDAAAGVATMEEAMTDATGSKDGGDKKIVLICYSGKAYAQAATNSLQELGANLDNVYTLEGGMSAWGEAGN